MENPLLLSEVAKLHQRDVMKEIVLRQEANQVKATKIARPGLIKRFVLVSETLLKKLVVRQKHETLSPDVHLFINTNT